MAVAARLLPLITTTLKTEATKTTMLMSSSKECRLWRWAKTVFFLISMLLSLLLVCAPPLLVAILDVLIPTSLLSTSPSLFDHLSFRNSLLDIPIISATRSIVILCVYVVCSGRGPYFGITVASSFLSAGYVSAKAAVMAGRRMPAARDGVAVEVLFLSSLASAVAHVAVAYKTSCRERRKMLVYRIDIESVSAYQNDFPNYHKFGLGKAKQGDIARSVIP